LIIIRPDLQTSFYSNEASLIQVVGTNLSLFTPRYDVNEICFPFASLAHKGSIHCKSEIRDCYTGLGIAQLRISYESPN